MELSQDECKIIISLLEKHSYDLKSAKVVLPIIDKLQRKLKQPDIKPEKQPNPVNKMPVDITI